MPETGFSPSFLFYQDEQINSKINVVPIPFQHIFFFANLVQGAETLRQTPFIHQRVEDIAVFQRMAISCLLAFDPIFQPPYLLVQNLQQDFTQKSARGVNQALSALREIISVYEMSDVDKKHAPTAQKMSIATNIILTRVRKFQTATR